VLHRPTGRPGEPIGWPWGRRPRRPLVPLILAGLIVAVVLVGTRQAEPPALTASCTTPALRLAVGSARQGRQISWSATGPAGRYVLAVDAAALRVSGGTPAVAREAAGTGPAATLASSAFAMTGCRASGRFGLALPEGAHTVRLFRLETATARPVAASALTVTP